MCGWDGRCRCAAYCCQRACSADPYSTLLGCTSSGVNQVSWGICWLGCIYCWACCCQLDCSAEQSFTLQSTYCCQQDCSAMLSFSLSTCTLLCRAVHCCQLNCSAESSLTLSCILLSNQVSTLLSAGLFCRAKLYSAKWSGASLCWAAYCCRLPAGRLPPPSPLLPSHKPRFSTDFSTNPLSSTFVISSSFLIHNILSKVLTQN